MPYLFPEFFFRTVNRWQSDLHLDDLLSSAIRKTGLSDWGDIPFQEPLRILLNALRQEAHLSEQGKFVLVQHYTRLLSNNLKLVEEWKNHPQIASVPVAPPIFIVGFPRTGTTYLHSLLAQDPAHRALRYWELLFPSPAPGPQTLANDSRIRMAKWFVRGIDWLSPKLSTIHRLEATSVEECCFIFDHLFLDNIHHLVFDVPSYIDWYDQHDPIPSYRFHRRMLQHYGSQYSFERFILKAPRHVYCLDALLHVYPDALIVWTHRDPVRALPSLCSLSETARRIVSHQIDLHRLGKLGLEYIEKDFQSGYRARQKACPQQIFDVHFSDLTRDPLATVQRIYNHFSLPYREPFDRLLRQQIHEPSQQSRATHAYSLETYGLKRDEIHERLHDYYNLVGNFDSIQTI